MAEEKSKEQQEKEYMVKFCKVLEEMHQLKERKTHDYGLECERSLGIQGLFVDINGKYHRLKNLIWYTQEIKVKDETVRDTYMDLAVYAVMSIIALDGNDKGIFEKQKVKP